MVNWRKRWSVTVITLVSIQDVQYSTVVFVQKLLYEKQNILLLGALHNTTFHMSECAQHLGYCIYSIIVSFSCNCRVFLIFYLSLWIIYDESGRKFSASRTNLLLHLNRKLSLCAAGGGARRMVLASCSPTVSSSQPNTINYVNKELSTTIV